MGSNASKLTEQEVNQLISVTEFDRDELQRWYKKFMRDNPTGCLNIEQFEQFYKHFFPSCEFSRLVFQVFDQNKDGCISFREFITVLSIASSGKVDDKIEWAFSISDLNKDGYISREELLYVVKAIYSVRNIKSPNIHSFSDEDTPDKRTDKLLEEMDKNKDGKISREEFCEGIKRDPWIIIAITDIGLSGIEKKEEI